jgi:hypothetical protein
MSVGVMKDYKLKQRNLRASHTNVAKKRMRKTVRFGDGHTAHKPLLFDTVSSSMTHVRSANL